MTDGMKEAPPPVHDRPGPRDGLSLSGTLVGAAELLRLPKKKCLKPFSFTTEHILSLKIG